MATTATVIDFKTGKRWGNEVKHAQQAQLYALGTALRYDEVQKIYTELWYVDQDELIPMTMTRAQALRFFKNWDDRNSMMFACVNFEPATEQDQLPVVSLRTEGHGALSCGGPMKYTKQTAEQFVLRVFNIITDWLGRAQTLWGLIAFLPPAWAFISMNVEGMATHEIILVITEIALLFNGHRILRVNFFSYLGERKTMEAVDGQLRFV